jgi:hypothetical protein
MKKMKKINLFLLAFILFISASGIAQNFIAVEHNNDIKMFYKLDSAVAFAQNGDILYVSGGSYDLGAAGLTIDKSLKIYGVGHYPDSTMATSASFLNGNVYITLGADSGLISGLFVNGNVTFGKNLTDQVVNNYTITRCNIDNLFLSFDGTSNSTSQSALVSENVFRNEFHGGNMMGLLFEKNIVSGKVRYCNSAMFKNNIFLANGNCCSDYPFTTVNGCTFENNVIRNTDYGYMWTPSAAGNIFSNNLFTGTFAWPAPYSNNGNAANIQGVNVDSIFVNQTGTLFSYQANYHLKATCLGKNAGTDGTDIGIFGTAEPYKEGAVPVNPHIVSKSVNSSTTPNGKLNVNIKVTAQTR